MTDVLWTAALCNRLEALWTSGMPVSGIASELGITRNSAIGKVHRMGLPERGSPILPRNVGRWARAEAMAREGATSHAISTTCQLNREMVRSMMHDHRNTARALPPSPSSTPRPPAAPRPAGRHIPMIVENVRGAQAAAGIRQGIGSVGRG